MRVKRDLEAQLWNKHDWNSANFLLKIAAAASWFLKLKHEKKHVTSI